MVSGRAVSWPSLQVPIVVVYMLHIIPRREVRGEILGLFERRIWCSYCEKKLPRKKFTNPNGFLDNCNSCKENSRIDKLVNQCKTEGCDNRKNPSLTNRVDWGYCTRCYRNLEDSFVKKNIPAEKQYQIKNLVKEYFPESKLRFELNSSALLLNDPRDFSPEQINGLVESTEMGVSLFENDIMRINSIASKNLQEIENQLLGEKKGWSKKAAKLKADSRRKNSQYLCERCKKSVSFYELAKQGTYPWKAVCKSCTREMRSDAWRALPIVPPHR